MSKIFPFIFVGLLAPLLIWILVPALMCILAMGVLSLPLLPLLLVRWRRPGSSEVGGDRHPPTPEGTAQRILPQRRRADGLAHVVPIAVTEWVRSRSCSRVVQAPLAPKREKTPCVAPILRDANAAGRVSRELPSAAVHGNRPRRLCGSSKSEIGQNERTSRDRTN
jgi:hypothetical protein